LTGVKRDDLVAVLLRVLQIAGRLNLKITRLTAAAIGLE
jgi:hypothetical protein